MNPSDILFALDHCYDSPHGQFIDLEHPYSYTADCRLNLFRNGDGHWAIVAEVLNYQTRGAGWAVALDIIYFGNCLVPVDEEGYNYYTVVIQDYDNFAETIDIGRLVPGATVWKIRDAELPLSHDRSDYEAEGIELRTFDPEDDYASEFPGEGVLRLLVPRHRDIFRATDEELYKGIPSTLHKVLVLDEWHHKRFHQSSSPFESPEFLASFDQGNPFIATMIQDELEKNARYNAKEWETRPSSYETWQQIAEVLATGDTSRYKPTLEPNTHWRYWPEGGSM
ncbi:MAG TPA: hypothetical protein VL547_07200 [Dinghuibacter sp.]|uniref:DUF7003 family protein n=1 Tax=Dinghuibacter sp. TaxID=2024697 RepID=UPI002C14A4F0|nr:hypothetical protein [Dinghuibacter sp.]HTJ11793.1 hypothetical protein [Dinghuibacter sp.]